MADQATVRAVLFDLDNTLLLEDESTERALRETCVGIADRIGAEVEVLAAAAREAADKLFGASPVFAYADAMGIWWGEALWGEFLGDTAGLRALREFAPDFRHRVWSSALASIGIADDTMVEAATNGFRSARRRTQLVDPDADAVVRDLARDHRLALVTNGAPDVQREKLSLTTLASLFEVMVISAEVGFGKPDRRIFETALAALEVAPEDAVMVGDSLPRDVAGAQALEALALGRQGSLQSLGKLGIVHRHYAKAGLQLANLDFGVGQFQIDCLHVSFLPAYFLRAVRISQEGALLNPCKSGERPCTSGLNGSGSSASGTRTSWSPSFTW